MQESALRAESRAAQRTRGPTNNRLIDRATRYVQILLRRDGMANCSYNQFVQALFDQLETLRDNQPIVEQTLPFCAEILAEL